jgi:hypothetical protein
MSAAPVTVKSSADQPIMLGDGFHCSDLKAANGQVDPTVRAVQESALAYMNTWLAEWTPLQVHSALEGRVRLPSKSTRSPGE